jgi:hypothetical protein
VLKWHPGAARWFNENAGADIPADMIHGGELRPAGRTRPAHDDQGPRPSRRGPPATDRPGRATGGTTSMTDQTSQTRQVLAEGVDEEPIEGNRRLFRAAPTC